MKTKKNHKDKPYGFGEQLKLPQFLVETFIVILHKLYLNFQNPKYIFLL